MSILFPSGCTTSIALRIKARNINAAMKYQRIHILGGPGSGKSTLADRIAALQGIPRTDLDDLFWDNTSAAYNTRRDPARRDQMLLQVLQQQRWIVEGVYHTWVTPSFERAETIIILAPPGWVRHWRIVRRFLRRNLRLEKCHKRETLKSLWGLLKWNHAFEGDNLKRARESLESYGQKVHEFSTVNDALRSLC
jgi:adenylate kinase family enzyme